MSTDTFVKHAWAHLMRAVGRTRAHGAGARSYTQEIDKLRQRTGEGSSDKEKRALSPLRNSSPIVNRPSCLRDVEKVRED